MRKRRSMVEDEEKEMELQKEEKKDEELKE